MTLAEKTVVLNGKKNLKSIYFFTKNTNYLLF